MIHYFPQGLSLDSIRYFMNIIVWGTFLVNVKKIIIRMGNQEECLLYNLASH